ncbi:hypothetical protein [Rhodoferax fermentans]|uniref:hypothetical protein n=1 Tax=Rhodoferax fermentans TaxID=28066 RepID=UPI001301B5DB|nr:hypothetical protein [Rhodoferax fermentans]
MNLEDVKQQAIYELHQEHARQQIEALKAQLRTRKTIWQRLADLLPFTLTWKKP